MHHSDKKLTDSEDFLIECASPFVKYAGEAHAAIQALAKARRDATTEIARLNSMLAHPAGKGLFA